LLVALLAATEERRCIRLIVVISWLVPDAITVLLRKNSRRLRLIKTHVNVFYFIDQLLAWLFGFITFFSRWLIIAKVGAIETSRNNCNNKFVFHFRLKCRTKD